MVGYGERRWHHHLQREMPVLTRRGSVEQERGLCGASVSALRGLCDPGSMVCRLVSLRSKGLPSVWLGGWSRLPFKAVADPAFGQQVRRVAGIAFQFAPQVADVDVDIVRCVSIFCSPHGCQDLLVGEDLAGMLKKYASSRYSVAVSSTCSPRTSTRRSRGAIVK